jgi:cholest-4-en-3-one 26-monooxygenase
MDLHQVDFSSPATFADGLPVEHYRVLRDQAPVSWHQPPDDPGYWLLVRHADVHQATVDAATYSSWLGGTSLREEPQDRLEQSRFVLLNMDPPQHTRYRKIITRAFAVGAVEKLAPRVAQLTRAIIDRVHARGECDFVRDIATLLPTQVIFELLGAPESDWERLHHLSSQMTYAEDPEMGGRGDETAIPAAMEMWSRAFELASERRAAPRDDLLSALTQAEVDGEKLTDPEINGFFLLLVIAGNEATCNLLSGGLLTLLQNPAELARLRADRSLISGAVEELLRYVSPVIQIRRTAKRDAEIHGQTIRAGQKVLIAFGSANHDERVFPEPERFDITRSPNPHLGFGVGPHLCLGATLARLEARHMLGEILDRMEDIELAGPTSRKRSATANSWKSIPIRFRPVGG